MRERVVKWRAVEVGYKGNYSLTFASTRSEATDTDDAQVYSAG